MTIFKPYDVRGVYPSEINEKIVYKIGRAFVTFLKCKKIVIARDMRLSSDSLHNALIKGFIDQGADVIDIGLASTPMFYYAVGKLEADGGIIITASHNPKQYNGLKFVKKGAAPINGGTGIQEIRHLVEGNDFLDVDKIGTITSKDLLNDYVNYVETYAKRIGGLKVVFDCANGMAGKTIIPLLNKFNIKSIGMYCELDGSFPNHEANPFKSDNTKLLQKRVIEEKADLGVAFDGDADRILLIDEKGNRVSGDILIALVAKDILCGRKEKIMYDLRSSKAVAELIKEEGGIPLISRVGHSFIKAKMRKEDVFFAGELSGHYYFRDNYYTDSAAIALMFVLSLLTHEKKPLSELISDMQKYYHSGEISRNVKDKKEVIRILRDIYSKGKISNIDGLTVEFDKWWFNLRESNTEPLIRLNLEADNEELMNEKVEELLTFIK